MGLWNSATFPKARFLRYLRKTRLDIGLLRSELQCKEEQQIEIKHAAMRQEVSRGYEETGVL